jgi:hypothetical protein
MQILLVIHVAISLIAIAAGFVIIFAMISNKLLYGWNTLFLATTIATSVSGFPLPADRLLPSHIVGILSLLVLALALYAWYARRLAGGWQRTYAITAVIAQYFNFFVLIVQSFLKIPFLHALAPTQKEPPFAAAQMVALIAFIALGYLAATRFKDPTTSSP